MDIKRRWNSIDITRMMLAALVVLVLYNIYSFGASNLFPIITTVATACLIDLAINYIKEKRLFIPRNAMITSLILSLVVQASLLLLILVAAIAILSKHVIKINGRHIFNPANFALFLALFLPVSESWWGMSNVLLVATMGLIIVYKLKRYHLVLPFLALHALLMLVIFAASTSQLVGHMTSGLLLFFTFYMLIEPITVPARRKSRIVFGALAGVFAAVLYLVWLPAMLVGALFFADLFVPLLNRNPSVKPKVEEQANYTTNPNW